MTKVIAVLNQKGGVGKTTISAHLGFGLQRAGHSVLLVDSDPQGSLRDWSAASEGEIMSVVGLDRETLAKDVETMKSSYDFVVIDGRAKAERMAGITVRTADLVIIPVSPSALDIWGASDLVEAIKARHEVTEGKPETRFLINLARKGTKLIDEVLPAIKDYNFEALNALLHLKEDYRLAMGEGVTVYQTKNADAIKEVDELIKEIKEILNES